MNVNLTTATKILKSNISATAAHNSYYYNLYVCINAMIALREVLKSSYLNLTINNTTEIYVGIYLH